MPRKSPNNGENLNICFQKTGQPPTWEISISAAGKTMVKKAVVQAAERSLDDQCQGKPECKKKLEVRVVEVECLDCIWLIDLKILIFSVKEANPCANEPWSTIANEILE